MVPEKFYEFIRAQIEHEDNLCNQRMLWLINLHSLLFGAYAFSLSAESNLVGNKIDHAQKLYNVITAARYGIFLAGVLTPLPVLLALYAAKKSIDRLVAKWLASTCINHDDFPQIIGNYRSRSKLSNPSRSNVENSHLKTPGVLLGQIPIFALPSILAIVWLYIALGDYWSRALAGFAAVSIGALAVVGAVSLIWPRQNID